MTSSSTQRPGSAQPRPHRSAPRVGEVIAVLDAAYPSALAESWDSVGLVCGDPSDRVARMLVCVDVTADVVSRAVESGCALILAHHPLLLRGVDRVSTDTSKGVLIHRLIRSGCALFTAHTNADRARPGVSDALAAALGVVEVRPLEPTPAVPLDKWVVMVPTADAETVSEAMFAVGAGEVGQYRRCSWQVDGTGQYVPVRSARPAIGQLGVRSVVAETRIEMVAQRNLRGVVLSAMRSAHPYEEPAYDILEEAATDSDLGLGRVGALTTPMTLHQFVTHVGQSLPRSGWGVRGAGDPDQEIRSVAVCGGAGEGVLSSARRSGADVYVTGDLRHHPVDEHLRVGPPALVDAGHWSTEFPWCGQAAEIVGAAFGQALSVEVYPHCTDPFVMRA